MSDMLTRFSINVSGKAEGKDKVADLLVAGLKQFGGAIAQRKGDKHGIYLSVEFSPLAMTQIAEGVADRPSDVVLPTLKVVNERNCSLLVDTLAKRAAAAKLLAADPEGRVQFATVPAYVPADDLSSLLVDCAENEIARCDAILESWGFRYSELAK